MQLEQVLETLPVAQWKSGQVYSFDWYDGPREGVCSLAAPGGEFHFELLEEQFDPDGLEKRLFRVSELPAGSVDEILSVVPDLASPSEPVRKGAEQRIRMIDARKRPTSLVILTPDMRHFLGCWDLDRIANPSGDWFQALGIP
jgi:hypothetical protein